MKKGSFPFILMGRRIIASIIYALLTMFLCISSIVIYAPGADAVRPPSNTHIVDHVTVDFPDSFPTSLVGFLLQSEPFLVPIDRRIGILWGGDGIVTVTFIMNMPFSPDVSEGVLLERLPGTFDVKVTMNRLGDSSWLNLTNHPNMYSFEPDALFGRATLGWAVQEFSNVSLGVSRKVVFGYPEATKIRYSSVVPDEIYDEGCEFDNCSSGFLYLESKGTKSATRNLLFVMAGLFAVIFAISFFPGYRERIRQTPLDLVARHLSRVSMRNWAIALSSLFLIILILCLVFGPSPRVNVAVIGSYDSSYLNRLSEQGTNVISAVGKIRLLEFMLSQNIIDVIILDDFLFEMPSSRWWSLLEGANNGEVPIYVSERGSSWNSEFLDGIDFVKFREGDITSLEGAISRKTEQKKGRNRLGLGWDIFLPVAVVIVVLSLVAVMGAATVAGGLAVYLSDRVFSNWVSLVLCILSFFTLFVFSVLLYVGASYLLEMPLGWHGPMGSAITAISLLSDKFGGGNFPRAFAALGGLIAILVILMSRERVKISLSLLALFSVLSMYLIVSTPLTAPTVLRVISGETHNVPPQDYFSRKSVNYFTSLEYRFHESISGVLMTILGRDFLVTWLSRGMIASLAFAGIFFLVLRNHFWTNAMILPGLLLVISRLFARVGDLQIEKSVWALPTALLLSALIAGLVIVLDRLLKIFETFLASMGSRRMLILGMVVVPLCTGFPILYIVAGTDRILAVLVGSGMLTLAALSLRSGWLTAMSQGKRMSQE